MSETPSPTPESAPSESPPEVAPVQPAETPPAEAPAEEKKETAGEDDRLRKGFAALSRKEKAIRQREQVFKAQEEQIRKVEALRQKAKESPLEVLQEFGLTYEQLTDFILSGDQPKEKTADDRVKALEERIEKDRAEREEQAKTAKVEDEKRKISLWKETVLAPSIKANTDRWECINAKGDEAIELVIDVMAEYTNKHGVPPAIELAADQVEKDLESEGRVYAGLKKFKAAQSPDQPINGNGSTLSRSKAGELPVVADGSLPLDPDERNKAILRNFRLWQ